MKRVSALVVASIALSGCVAAPPADPPILVRTDGQKITGNPALEQQVQIDQTVCKGQMSQSASNMQPFYTGGGIVGAMAANQIQAERAGQLLDVTKGCLAQKGYVLVPTSQADAIRIEFAKTAKARQKTG